MFYFVFQIATLSHRIYSPQNSSMFKIHVMTSNFTACNRLLWQLTRRDVRNSLICVEGDDLIKMWNLPQSAHLAWSPTYCLTGGGGDNFFQVVVCSLDFCGACDSLGFENWLMKISNFGGLRTKTWAENWGCRDQNFNFFLSKGSLVSWFFFLKRRGLVNWLLCSITHVLEMGPFPTTREASHRGSSGPHLPIPFSRPVTPPPL